MVPVTRMVLAAAVLLAAQCIQASPNGFRDPLDTPVRESSNAARASLMAGVQKSSGELLAVGRRGMVLRSADGGKSWKQSKVPLSTDLLAVSFVNDKQGWAVGHAGVIIHTADGGDSWQRQLDGRSVPDLLIRKYKPDADAGNEAAQRNLMEAERFKEDGPGRPFLSVFFTDEKNGLAVGAYNLAVRTSDGGKTWEPFSDQIDNLGGMHLYAISRIDGVLWIAGEQGVLLKQETPGGPFVRVKTPYEGTFFGISGDAKDLYAFGLRGNALRSGDGGVTWTAMSVGTQSNLTSGAVLANGELVLGAMSGELFRSRDGGATFQRVTRQSRGPLFGLSVAGAGRLLLLGPTGASVQELTEGVAVAQSQTRSQSVSQTLSPLATKEK